TSQIPGGGQKTQFTMPLTGTIATSAPLTVKMTMDSPAGSASQPVAMNPNTQTFNAAITPTLRLSNASVSILAQPITPSVTPINMAGVKSLRARVQDTTAVQGSMYITVTNPFSVNGVLTLTYASQPGDSAIT